MKLIAVFFVTLLLCACATESESEAPNQIPSEAWNPPQNAPEQPQPAPPRPAYDVAHIQEMLGMRRSAMDLGYAEKGFDGCRYGVQDQNGSCGRRYMSVINFRVICRDTEGTIQDVASGFRPLERNLEWRLAGAQGTTSTDSQGFGQVAMIYSKSPRSQRFMLIMGGRSLGVEAGEVKQIIVPNDWCESYGFKSKPESVSRLAALQ